MDYQAVVDEVESWPIEDRLRLVEDLSDRLSDRGEPVELSEELKQELDRRIDELDRDPGSGVPWEDAKARVLERFGS